MLAGSTVGGVFNNPFAFKNDKVVYEQQQALSEDELSIIVSYEEESLRLGNFERIFPLNSNTVHYFKYFEYKRPSNLLLMKYLKCYPNFQ